MVTLRSILHAHQATWMFANFMLQSTIVILIAAVISRVVIPHKPAQRHTLWLFTMLFLPFVPLQGGIYQLVGSVCTVEPRELPPSAVSTPHNDGSLPVSSSGANQEDTPTSPSPTFASASWRARNDEVLSAPSRSNSPLPYAQSVARYFGLIWSVGLAVGLMRMAHGVYLLRRIVSSGVASQESAIGIIAHQACAQVDLRSVPQIVLTDRVSAPITVGVMFPTVVLPSSAVHYSRAELLHVLLHEFAHIKRHDAWVGVFQRLLVLVCWPQFLVRFASRQLSRAREEVCDNFVLKASSATTYARTLVSLAEQCRFGRHTRYALRFFPVRWSLESRLQGLLTERRDQRTHASARLRAAASMTLVVILIGTGSVSTKMAPAFAQGGGDATAGAQSKIDELETLADGVPQSAIRFVEVAQLAALRSQLGSTLSKALSEYLATFFHREYVARALPVSLVDLCQSGAESIALAELPKGALVVVEGDPRVLARVQGSIAATDTSKRVVASTAVTVSKRDGFRELYSFVHRRRLHITNAEPVVNDLLASEPAFRSLAENPPFRETVQRASLGWVGDADVTWYHAEPSRSSTRRRGNDYPWNRIDYDGGVVSLLPTAALRAQHRTWSRIQADELGKIRQGLSLQRTVHEAPEAWVPEDVSTYATLHIDLPSSIVFIKDAIDKIVDSSGFVDDVLDSFRSDPSGPMIDLDARLFPHLGSRVSAALGFGGDHNKSVVSIHVTNDQAVRDALLQLFEKDTQAEPPIETADAFLILLKPETDQPDISLGANPQRAGGASGVAVIDHQLLFSSDFETLRRVVQGRRTHEQLRANSRFQELAGTLRKASPSSVGRVFSTGNVSTLPPFLPKLLARFRDDPPFIYERPSLGAQASALSIRMTNDGFVIDGIELGE